jgi:hypothetical protein
VRALDKNGYEAAFRDYERSRAEYASLQEDIRLFLAEFGEDPALGENGFSVRDLAHMEGLRVQRDAAYETYRELEKVIFGRLSKRWGGEPD